MTEDPDKSALPHDPYENGADDSPSEQPAQALPQAIKHPIPDISQFSFSIQQTGFSPSSKISPALMQQLALNLDNKSVVIDQPAAAPASVRMTASALPPELPVVQQHTKRLKAGEILREAREEKGWLLEDIAEEIKVKPTYLQAIEELRYADLPSRTHAVGFVRSYAGLLELNAEELASRMRHEIVNVLPQASVTPGIMAYEEKADHGGGPRSSIIVFCIVFALFAYALGYGFLRPATQSESAPASLAAAIPAAAVPAPVQQAAVAPQQHVQQPVQQQALAAQPTLPQQVAVNGGAGSVAVLPPQNANEAQPGLQQNMALPISTQQAVPQQMMQQPVQVATAQPGATGLHAAAPSRIRLQATDQITVQIYDAGGHMLASRVIAKGEAFFIPDKTNYTLATNNAGALRLQVDGREMPPLGAPEEPMHNIPLNADQLLSALN